MIPIRKLASALCLVLLFTKFSGSNAQTLDPTQTYATDNLVGNTGNSWSGCYSNTSGSFWGGIFGGPCPGVRSDGYMVFSYGQTTLSQTIAINQALANTGSGLQISGYNYSWTVKNSNINGWQPGGYDPIAYIDVNLYSSTGSLLVNDRYNYGYHLPQWTTFSGTRNYASPYSLAALGNIQLAVTSKDSGFWAGYYGPEFMNFNLSLNYRLDPCSGNPLYSPTCPGYDAAFAAKLSQNSSTSNPILVSYSTSSGNTSITLTPDSTRTDPTLQNAGGVELTTTGELSPPDNVPTIVKESSKENKKSQINLVHSTAIALSTISRNEKREQNIIKNVQEQAAVQALSGGLDQQNLIDNIIKEQIQRKNEDSGSDSSPSSIVNSNNNTINTTLQSITIKPVETTTQQNGPTVNKNAPNNELAGGLDIAVIARSPVGFELYMNGMRDAPFYPPKEIYKGQRTVDNARAERFLNGASDVLHQRMIEQQYNLGN